MRNKLQSSKPLSDDIFGAVDAQRVAGKPGRFFVDQQCQRIGDVRWSGESAVWVSLGCDLDHLFVAGNLAQGRSIRDPRADGIYRHLVGGKLQCELAAVGLERGLRGRDSAVRWPYPSASGGG